MHAYYQDNQKKLRKGMNSFLKLIKPELEEKTGQTYEKIEKETWRYYRENMLENFPYIGGDKISGTRNLTGAYFFVALGVICKKYGISMDEWGYMCTLSYRRYFGKIPGFVRTIMRKLLLGKPDLVRKMLKKKDVQNAENAKMNPGSFETKTQEPTAQYPVIYHNIVCPLCNFAKKYGYMEYMPYICNLDYVMFEVLKVPFYREKTCVHGDAYCDFKMKKGAPVIQAWPCHGLKEEDILR